MPLSIKGTLNWQEYLSEKGKNAGKWSREGKNGQNQMYFFPYNFYIFIYKLAINQKLKKK